MNRIQNALRAEGFQATTTGRNVDTGSIPTETVRMRYNVTTTGGQANVTAQRQQPPSNLARKIGTGLVLVGGAMVVGGAMAVGGAVFTGGALAMGLVIGGATFVGVGLFGRGIVSRVENKWNQVTNQFRDALNPQ